MSFKTHLLVVSAIIAIVYFAWQMMYVQQQPVVVETSPQPQSDSKSIQIIRASWGLNCSSTKFSQNGVAESPANFAEDSSAESAMKENNVLEIVSKLCNGQPSCTITPSVETMGFDPQPQCFDKQLEVEYRCFAFDRPWRIRGSNNAALQIDCGKKGG